MIKTGDFVRIKSWLKRPQFIAVVNDRGMVGGAHWWPDAWWNPNQIDRIIPTEDRPDDWCQFVWNPELLE